MYFQHSAALWSDHPDLVAGAVFATGITADVSAAPQVERFAAIARGRLAAGPESELPEIQAWRRTFARMGLKPTQYRCASESLLRRFRKEGELPRIHPMIDLCNAISIASAIPVGVFDVARIPEGLEVRHATGDEHYETFAGQIENPDPREVIFADPEGRAHARRWTNRQSGYSAVRESTTTVLVVVEGMHRSASTDVAAATASIVDEISDVWSVTPTTAILTQSAPRFAP